ncbi:hypothetical protein, partial [Daejeonella sp.]|uniref:hypothetical protein n=1 Tax=Daejeonella sp. TaxID=2805397 RepID=UPI003983B348
MITKYLIAGFILVSFGARAQGNAAFFRELQSKKGKTFYGKTIYMPDTTKANDFWGKELSFTVNKRHGELKMPFIVGENKSRTWILKKTRGRLELKHDHRHEDGKPDSISNYG